MHLAMIIPEAPVQCKNVWNNLSNCQKRYRKIIANKKGAFWRFKHERIEETKSVTVEFVFTS